MKTKITYEWINNYNDDEAIWPRFQDLEFEGLYDFGDWLRDRGVAFETENNCYFVLEDYFSAERTGEVYRVVNSAWEGIQSSPGINFRRLVYSQIKSKTTRKEALEILEVLREFAKEDEYIKTWEELQSLSDEV